MPEDDSDAYRDIQGVLCTELRDLETEVGCINHVLANSCHLVSEYDSILAARLRSECVKHHGADRLLGTYDRIAIFLETTHSFHGVIDMFPCDAVFRSEGGLVDFCRRRNGTDAAKPDLVYLERIRCPECGADIVCAPDIVKHYNKP